MTVQHVVRQTQFQTYATNFIFEQFTQRFNQTHLHIVWQTANVMVRLDNMRFAGFRSGRLDHIRINGALSQPFRVSQFLRFIIEYFHKHATDGFTFQLRIINAFQCRQEALFRIHLDDVQTEMIAEHFHHLMAFVQTQQTVINEYAGQSLADSSVDQHRHNGRIHTTGQTQNHLVITDLLFDTLNGIFDDGGWCPQCVTLTDIFHKTLQHTGALLGVSHFRMELYTVEAFGFIGHRRMRTGWRSRNSDEISRNGRNLITVTHPYIQLRTAVLGQRVFDIMEQVTIFNQLYFRVTKLTLVRTFN